VFHPILVLTTMFKAQLLVAVVAAVSNEDWEAWKQEYGVAYNGEDEDHFRQGVFEENMARAAEVQARNPKAKFGSNKFSDMTPEEFKKSMLNFMPSDVNMTLPEEDVPNVEVPSSQDWTGIYTTAVKDQGHCGSCWAFSAAEQIEADAARELGTHPTLAPQQLVDCTSDGAGSQRDGCQGGWPYQAYGVIQALGGMAAESDYSYKATNGICKSAPAVVSVADWSYVGKKSEAKMQTYVGSTGPLSVCVDANSWSSYTGGVMTSCGTSVDHCVQLVGYGTDAEAGDYWKVRNSWASTWGEAGFLRIKSGKNLCLISNYPTKVTPFLPQIQV